MIKDKIPQKNIKALKILVDRLQGKKLMWALIGSTGLAIHGVDVTVNDIDISTTIKNADKIAVLLKEYNTVPLGHKQNEFFKSYYAAFLICDVKIELIANLECHIDGKWVKTGEMGKIVMKKYKDMTIPLLDLNQEYKAYKSMGRMEKANKILKTLQKSKKK